MAEVSSIGGGNAYLRGISSYASGGNGLTRGSRSSRENPAASDAAEISPEAKKMQAEDSTDETTGLSEDEKKDVENLKKRDLEVRQHEQAHIMAGGSLVRGGASFTYKTGPDGKQYAVGGEVNIDCSPVDGDPRATIRKAQQVQKAAAAPAQPSGQDRAVAAEAAAMELKALRELSQQNTGTQTSGVNRTA